MPRIIQRSKEKHNDTEQHRHVKSRYGREGLRSSVQSAGRKQPSQSKLGAGRLKHSFDKSKGKHVHEFESNYGNNNRSFKEETTIPDPIPDTGYYHTKAETLSSRPSHVNHHKSEGSAVTSISASTFSLYPPLFTAYPSSMAIQASPAQAISPSPSEVSPEDFENASSSSAATRTAQQHKSATILIVCLALGSAALIAISFFVFRLLTRPKKRPRPKPSLPILDDSFSDEKALQDGSPVFGGKERSSFRPGSGGTWTWTQYRPGDTTTSGSLPTYGATTRSPRIGTPQNTVSSNTYLQPPPDTRTCGYSPFSPVLQQAQKSVSNLTSRFSAASVSLYPASPQQDEIGLAIGSMSPQTAFTGDGHHALRRKDSRKSLERTRNDELDYSAGLCSQKSRLSQLSPCAYDGVEMESPIVLPYCSPEQPTKRAGRTRVKSSYYGTGTYLRGSVNSTHKPSRSESHLSSRTIDYSQEYLPSLVPNSSTRSELVVVSPQPSLYPDDSVSVVGTRHVSKPSHRKKASEHNLSKRSSQHYTADLDQIPVNLKRSISDAGERNIKRMSTSEAVVSRTKKANVPTEKSSSLDDKPPYLPLPAPLPSLSQMALESADPQGYADYRSPTYSIYGFYEAERN